MRWGICNIQTGNTKLIIHNVGPATSPKPRKMARPLESRGLQRKGDLSLRRPSEPRRAPAKKGQLSLKPIPPIPAKEWLVFRSPVDGQSPGC